MYYFTHPNGDTATCENPALIPGLEGRGYQRCTPAEHRAAWQARDAQRRLEGDIPPPGWVEAQDLDAMPYKERVRLGV